MGETLQKKIMVVLWAIGVAIAVRADTPPPPSVAENVMTALRVQGLSHSIDVIETYEDHVVAVPHRRADGTNDTSLLDYIRLSRKEGKREWIHDNTVCSWFWGHGTYSYRQRVRPSLHATFFFSPDGKLAKIKLDVDRFPPGSTKITSARHLIQELIPNKLFGKKTDQTYIAGALQRRYHLAAAPKITANSPSD